MNIGDPGSDAVHGGECGMRILGQSRKTVQRRFLALDRFGDRLERADFRRRHQNRAGFAGRARKVFGSSGSKAAASRPRSHSRLPSAAAPR